MRSFLISALIKILPEHLTSTALAFILEREGAPATCEELPSEAPIYIAPDTTTSAAF